MSHVKSKVSRRVAMLVGLLGAAALSTPLERTWAQSTQPLSTQPFAGLSGKWVGEGSIALSNGTTERMRCDATYVVSGGGEILDQSLRCESDSYKFDLRVNLSDKNGEVLGSWQEIGRSITGGISGRELERPYPVDGDWTELQC